MEERRDGLHGDGEMEAGDALCKEGADEGTLVDRQMGLCELEVAPGPALLECREQSAKQACDEAQEPEHVDPDGRSWRVPASCRLEEESVRGVVGKGPVRETVELLGYLSEEDDSVSRRVRQQGLVAIDDERGECCCEKTSLPKAGLSRQFLVRDDAQEEDCVRKRVFRRRPLSRNRSGLCRVSRHAIGIKRTRRSKSRCMRLENRLLLQTHPACLWVAVLPPSSELRHDYWWPSKLRWAEANNENEIVGLCFRRTEQDQPEVIRWVELMGQTCH